MKYKWNVVENRTTTFEQLKSCVDPKFLGTQCASFLTVYICIFHRIKRGNTCFVQSSEYERDTHNQIDLFLVIPYVNSNVMQQIDGQKHSYILLMLLFRAFYFFFFFSEWQNCSKTVCLFIYWYNVVYMWTNFYSRYVHKKYNVCLYILKIINVSTHFVMNIRVHAYNAQIIRCLVSTCINSANIYMWQNWMFWIKWHVRVFSYKLNVCLI